MDGGDLQEALAAQGRLPTDEARRILDAALSGYAPTRRHAGNAHPVLAYQPDGLGLELRWVHLVVYLPSGLSLGGKVSRQVRYGTTVLTTAVGISRS
jgi:hypothetical protein